MMASGMHMTVRGGLMRTAWLQVERVMAASLTSDGIR